MQELPCWPHESREQSSRFPSSDFAFHTQTFQLIFGRCRAPCVWMDRLSRTVFAEKEPSKDSQTMNTAL